MKTQNLLLRPIRESDVHHVFKGLSHPEVIRYYGVSFSTLEETKVQMDWYATIEKDETGQWWAVCDPGDQHFYGAIGFNDIHPVHHRAEIGFWLLPAYWGKGYIPEAASVIIRYAFEEMELHRIYGYVETENQNSKKVLQKLGFEYEGRMRECEMKNGEWIDLETFSILNNLEVG
ncbi:MAG: GNAT family N-acetyltransferase [Saprospiraceae bacterium]|nr:GNAT family N-acetyltransferase [Saprospiraceae bacterium]